MLSQSKNRQLVLASTSPSRRMLLERLKYPFAITAPQVDETPLPNEAPINLVTRLSEAKARAGAQDYPHAMVIGSDQVAYLDDTIIGKPGTTAAAIMQLERASGRSVLFYTGLCLLDAKTGQFEVASVTCKVHFRNLTRAQIEGYIAKEAVINCAGSFKSESLGVALFQRVEGDDPSSLMGLPLICLCSMLERMGVSVLNA